MTTSGQDRYPQNLELRSRQSTARGLEINFLVQDDARAHNAGIVVARLATQPTRPKSH